MMVVCVFVQWTMQHPLHWEKFKSEHIRVGQKPATREKYEKVLNVQPYLYARSFPFSDAAGVQETQPNGNG
jgi:hypothetical protein